MGESFTLFKSDKWGNPVLIRVEGHLDAKSAVRLVEACQETRSQGKNLVLNLSRVTFIASSGVGSILAMVEYFNTAGLSLSLTDLSPAVEAVLKLLNLDQFLTIYADESTARTTVEV